MEDQRFDQWTRSLSAFGASRRAMTQIFAGSALAAMLARFGREDAAAKCVKPGKKCKKKRGKKQKCCGDAKCKGKKCQCPEDQIAAGDQCVTGRGTCVQGDDSCLDACNDSPQCSCHVTMEGVIEGTNAVRCGDNSIQSQCGECTTDADCSSYGPGAFCAMEIYPAGFCAGCALRQGFCRTPCPS